MSQRPDIILNTGGIERGLATLRNALNALSGKDCEAAIAGALNKGLTAARKEAARIARQEYTAPIKKLFDNIQIFRARRGDLVGRLVVRGSVGVSLIHFRAKPATPGRYKPGALTVQVKRKGGRKSVEAHSGRKNPIIIRKKQGGFGIFARNPSQKLDMLFGPSPVQAIGRQDSQERIASLAEEDFTPRLREEIDKILSKVR